ncbi:SDR family NAD(P)-dependent oxidoreductase [Bradyrhizobium sp. ma5]|uniref:SDR family NAD(P)-dependent oxidoreductase n=1 Tax=Bradyrhizobium sp. ma5 TaxID=3344828 RepID=UPI0035D40180
MSIRLDGRVAAITGAGAGLGRSHALLFASLGAKVVVNDLGATLDGRGEAQSAADAVVEEIKSQGGTAVANHDSVADETGARRIVQSAITQFGRIDILVNNAGILRDKSFAKMETQDFLAVLAVHLHGGFHCCKAAWPHMLEQKYGRIILTTSPSTNGNFGQSGYAAAKLGLIGMMNCLALEGSKHDVLVNAISPGAVTRMTERVTPPHLLRYLRPELVSPAVAWLASEACRISGQTIAASAGGFSRVHAFETRSVQFDPELEITVDMIDEAFPRISDLSAAVAVQPGPLGDVEERLRSIGRLGVVGEGSSHG